MENGNQIKFEGTIFMQDKEAREYLETLDNRFSKKFYNLNEKVKSQGREIRELKKIKGEKE